MRTFVAIDVPAMESVLELQRAIVGRVKLVEPENLHITLKFLGEVSETRIPEIKAAVGKCITGHYSISLRGVGFFPSERYVKVVWVGVMDGGETGKMMRCIDDALAGMGFKRERSYVPHLTVARAKGPVDVHSLAKFKGTEFGNVDVREIKIKKSTLTPSGPVYEDVAVFGLE